MTDDLIACYCPTCNKEFYPTPMWAYKYSQKIYCSWKCLQVKFKEDEAKRLAVKAKQVNRVYKKIQQVDADGTVVAVFESAFVAADAIDGMYGSVYSACRNGKKYKKFYWRYQDEDAVPVTKPTPEKRESLIQE